MNIYHVFNKAENGLLTNVGDMLGPYIYKKMNGLDYTYYPPSDDSTTLTNLVCGSIIELSKKNCIIYSCGLNTDKEIDNLNYNKIISVRGKLTYDILKKNNIKVPRIFGDLGLLLPYIYNPKIKIKYKYGIIPHVNQISSITNLIKRHSQIKIIDFTEKNIEIVIDQMLECENIISTSLHGVIISHAYNINVLPIKYENLLNEFKFADHYSIFSSITSYSRRIDITNIEEIDIIFLDRLFKEHSNLLIKNIDTIIDRDFLWKLCPLNPNKSLNILFLSDKLTHFNLLERDFYNQYICCKTITNLNSQYNGYKIDEIGELSNHHFSYKIPIEEQIESIYCNKYFFDIICTLPGGGIYDISFYTKHHATSTLIHFHETFNNLAIEVLNKIDNFTKFHNNFNIIIFKSLHEKNYYLKNYSSYFKNKIVDSIPQLPILKYSFKKDLKDKDIDIGIIGNLNNNIYPLRLKIYNILREDLNLSTKVKLYTHTFLETFTFEDCENNKGKLLSLEQENSYINFLHRCKIVICTRSIYDYYLKKFSEAGLSKCLIIGNIPTDYYEELQNFIIDVSKLSDLDIVDTIIYWLNNEDKRNLLVENFYNYILKNLTMCNQLKCYQIAHEKNLNK